jgi:hypothetical protein
VIHERGADSAPLNRTVHVEAHDFDSAVPTYSCGDVIRRAHVRVANRLSVLIFHYEDKAAFGLYRAGNRLDGIRVAEVPAKVRLGVCRPVRLHKEPCAE